MSAANPELVEVIRGPVVESRHRCSVAVVDGAGSIVRSWGDISRVILPRSALKPIQAISMVESGAADAYNLGSEELALHCSSHSGEPGHINRVLEWLGRIGCTESDLECGPQRSLGLQQEPNQPGNFPEPSRAANNCSGKHAGFLTTARHLGVEIAGYVALDHAVQKQVRRTVAEMAGESAEAMPVGFDNCGAPVFGLPLSALALAAARLAKMEGLSSERATACKWIVKSMREHPWLVAGTDRAETTLMQDHSFAGIAKGGAEGVFLMADPGSGLGVAIKVDDGGDRAASALGLSVLHEIGVIDASAHERLASAINKTILNTAGETISSVRVRPL